MFPYLNLFGLALPVPPLTILAGIYIGSALAEKHAGRHKVNPDHLYNLVFIALVAGVLGARLAYVARYPAAFIENPRSLISPNFGLFDPLGGALAAVVVALAFGQRKAMKLWPTLDALTPAFAILMLAAAAANFASGEAFGAPSTLPWAVELWGAQRHPSQLYEALAAGVILYLLWPARQPKKTIPGTTIIQFAAYSAAARLVLEAFRGSSALTFFNLRSAQVNAWLIMAAAFWIYARLQGDDWDSP